jgi:TolB-like protein/cytochrome c-type biogenesis protein CcmH/NrfG
VERATSKRHPVVSLRIDQAPLPAGLEYFLNTSQWLDASAGDTVRAMPKLVAAVRIAIEKTATPDAVIAGTPSRASSRAGRVRSQHRVTIVGASLATVAIAGFAAYKLVQPAHRAIAPPEPTVTAATPAVIPAALTIPEKSVAVLPFTDMSEKKDQEYFSDGMAEAIIDLLVKVPELYVPARTSSFYFKGKSEDIPTISRRLAVAHVLEGSVRKSGNHFRIAAQLVRADNGYHVWSETYDRKLDDIFKVQDEIALAVVTALKASLLQQDLDRSTITARPGVYTLYLQGISSWNRGTAEDFHKAVDYFRRALALDPNYVPALGILGQVLVDEFIYSENLAEMRAVSAQVHDAAQKAIALDPKSSDGHLAMARAVQEFDWHWETAEAEYKSAMNLDPKNAEAFGMASHLASLLGHHDQAVRLAANATKIDPLNSFTHLYLGWAQSSRGNLAEAEAAYRKSLELNPAAGTVRGSLGLLLLLKGDATAALAEIDQEPDEMTRRGLRPLALDALGRRTDADREIAALEQTPSDHPYLLAAIYASRNDSNRAFALLDLAYQQHNRSLPYLRTDDRFRNLAGDPRYKALLRKMNLPE